MIKKILTIGLLSSFLFAENISLTGETLSQLGNPYKIIFGEKNKTIKVFSDKKEIKLKVNSNYNGSKEEFVLNNESIIFVMKQFYGEEYKVIVDNKSDVYLNILSGEVNLDYTDLENNIQTLREIVVSLNVEIIINGNKINKKITLDNTLGDKNNSDYQGFITNEDIMNLKITSVKENVIKIIERELFNIMRETK